MKKIQPTSFQKQLLKWFDQQGRKNLPWQQNKSPYRVWISEIMLQQTQVKTVIPYFLRFMERFPNVETLAAANQDEVLHLWTGLGYYNRARNLHKAAKIIFDIGHFPNNLEQLQALPGVGRSTAGAILAIAFEKPASILDGNVKRVLCRLTGTREWPGEKNTLTHLWLLAEQLTPKQRVADYTQAMMDLGATVCMRGQPHCHVCPFKKNCIAHHLGIEKQLPRSKPKKQLPIKATTFFILNHNQNVLLHKRPDAGIWAGLWSLPEMPGTLSKKAIQQYCQKTLSQSDFSIRLEKIFRHTFTHFHLDILPVFITLQHRHTPSAEIVPPFIWYDLLKPQEIGLPMPVKKLLEVSEF